jgi:hypothetical protein
VAAAIPGKKDGKSVASTQKSARNYITLAMSLITY